MSTAVLVLLAPMLLLGDFPPKTSTSSDKKPTDAEKIDGTWVLREWYVGGVDVVRRMGMDDVTSGKVALIFSGGKYHARREVFGRTGYHMTFYPEGTFVLRPERTPKEMDQTITLWPGNEKTHGTTSRNIYKLDGDTLIVAYRPPGSPLPTRFKTEKGDDVSVLVYEREKPAREKK